MTLMIVEDLYLMSRVCKDDLGSLLSLSKECGLAGGAERGRQSFEQGNSLNLLSVWLCSAGDALLLT